MFQLFIRFSEFAEFTAFKESSALFRGNPNVKELSYPYMEEIFSEFKESD